MKKKSKITLCIVALVSAVLIFIGCSRVFILSNDNAVMTFIDSDTNIVTQTLTEEETAKIKELFSGCSASFFDLPACPFDDNITISFGGQVFAVACDACETVKECKPARYFSITPEGKEYITALFEKYGGNLLMGI